MPAPTTCWKSECLGINFPYAKVEPNQVIPVSVTFKNTGNVTWTNAEYFRLGSQSPQDNFIWGLNRVLLPLSTDPLKNVTFQFEVTAPSAPGTYSFAWKMLSEIIPGINVGGWFGETCSQTVQVVTPCLSTTVPLTATLPSLTLPQNPEPLFPIECAIKYSSLPKREGMQPEFSSSTEIPLEPAPIDLTTIDFTCSIKTIPEEILSTSYIGNNGLGFPVNFDCNLIGEAIEENCYIALECGNDPSCSVALIQEDGNIIGDGKLAAPCLSGQIIFQDCYLVKEEDGFTPFEVEENTNYFIVNCIEDN